jgi:hypothetical protein
MILTRHVDASSYKAKIRQGNSKASHIPERLHFRKRYVAFTKWYSSTKYLNRIIALSPNRAS